AQSRAVEVDPGVGARAQAGGVEAEVSAGDDGGPAVAEEGVVAGQGDVTGGDHGAVQHDVRTRRITEVRHGYGSPADVLQGDGAAADFGFARAVGEGNGHRAGAGVEGHAR